MAQERLLVRQQGIPLPRVEIGETGKGLDRHGASLARAAKEEKQEKNGRPKSPEVPCVPVNPVDSTRLAFVRVLPDEVTDASEEGDHETDGADTGEYHYIDEHDLPPALALLLRWVQGNRKAGLEN
jgi:hypothetical protein